MRTIISIKGNFLRIGSANFGNVILHVVTCEIMREPQAVYHIGDEINYRSWVWAADDIKAF